MTDYLPRVYHEFTDRYPDIASAQGELARAVREASPFDDRTSRLIKFALAVGGEAEGAVRSNVRKGLDAGLTEDELRAVALLAITTCGFPTAVAALKWIDEVLGARASASDSIPPE